MSQNRFRYSYRVKHDEKPAGNFPEFLEGPKSKQPNHSGKMLIVVLALLAILFYVLTHPGK